MKINIRIKDKPLQKPPGKYSVNFTDYQLLIIRFYCLNMNFVIYKSYPEFSSILFPSVINQYPSALCRFISDKNSPISFELTEVLSDLCLHCTNQIKGLEHFDPYSTYFLTKISLPLSGPLPLLLINSKPSLTKISTHKSSNSSQLIF